MDAVIAGEAHRREDGDALFRGRVIQLSGTHRAVTGGGTWIHHGGQSEWFCKVWEDIENTTMRNCSILLFLSSLLEG